MARRLPSVIALVAVLLLTLPTAAFAYSAGLERPSNGVVTGTTEVHVRVAREPLEVPITGLRVRPAGRGEWQRTECVRDCDGGERPVFKFTLDPRTGAPFGGGIMSNGDFVFEGRISRDFHQDDHNVGRFTLHLRVPGSAVGGLAATVSGDAVRLAWSRAPEPDIAGYRVERCAGSCDGGGSWRAIADLPASASSHSDEPGVGAHSYRVVTVRSGGAPKDGKIETVSSPVTAEVEPRPESPADEGSGDGDGSGDGNGGGGDGDGSSRPGRDGSDGDGGPRTGDAPDIDRDGASDDGADQPRTASSRSSSRTGGTRFGGAPSVSLGRGGAGIPELPHIGDIFRGELDYSADDPQAAGDRDGEGNGDGGGEGDEVVLSAPGRSGGSFLGRLTDPNRIAIPIAGGLLMTAVGLHLWRWLRIPLA